MSQGGERQYGQGPHQTVLPPTGTGGDGPADATAVGRVDHPKGEPLNPRQDAQSEQQESHEGSSHIKLRGCATAAFSPTRAADRPDLGSSAGARPLRKASIGRPNCV